MKKYIQVFKIAWESGFVYRLNFVLWRLRSFLTFLTLFFFWQAVYIYRDSIGDYRSNMILTYVFGVAVLRIIVGSSKTADAASDIATGDLTNYLLRPINYFRYWLFRDFADKALNLIFLVFELGIVFALLKPDLFIPQDPLLYIGAFVAALVGMLVFFHLSMLISLTAFWYPESEGWPQRFLFAVVIEFLSGLFIPLDILPRLLFNVLKILPTTYMLFFPIEVFLGRIDTFSFLSGLAIAMFWLWLLSKANNYFWQQGLKNYSATGR